MDGEISGPGPGDICMASAATATPSKTSFVREFLSGNPQGNVKALNEAWTAAGYDGTISPTLFKNTKARLGLTRNRRGKTETTAKRMAAPNTKTATATPGKTSFLKEFLHEHPEGNVRAANEAWTAAGFEGTISPALVIKTRASLGLTDRSKKPRTAAKAAPTGKRQGRPPKATMATVDAWAAGRGS